MIQAFEQIILIKIQEHMLKFSEKTDKSKAYCLIKRAMPCSMSWLVKCGLQPTLYRLLYKGCQAGSTGIDGIKPNAMVFCQDFEFAGKCPVNILYYVEESL